MISWLEALKDSKKLVIVEGKKDKLALEKLGVKRSIALSRKPVFQFVEEVSSKYKEVVILTDLDKEGKRLYHQLKQGLQKHGIKVDNKFRESLFKNTHLSQIEGICSYYKKHQSEFEK